MGYREDLDLVQRDGYALKNLEEQTLELCLAAVNQNGYALKYVKIQTPQICLAAVRQEGCALRYVKEQSTEICKAAIENDKSASVYIGKQCQYFEASSEPCADIFGRVNKHSLSRELYENHKNEVASPNSASVKVENEENYLKELREVESMHENRVSSDTLTNEEEGANYLKLLRQSRKLE